MTFRPTADPQSSEPFTSDEDAVAAAKSWVTQNFRIRADDLEVSAIDHSASGNPEPLGADDRGHTIVLKQLYRGIPTDGYAVVYMRGKAITTVAVGFYDYTPLPGSAKPGVSSEAAVSAWRTLFKQRGATEDILAEYDRRVAPRLHFVHSVRPGARDEHAVPTWVIMEGEPYMVDAHTGKTWVND